jgi:hypothetical protein
MEIEVFEDGPHRKETNGVHRSQFFRCQTRYLRCTHPMTEIFERHRHFATVEDMDEMLAATEIRICTGFWWHRWITQEQNLYRESMILFIRPTLSIRCDTSIGC